MRRIGEVYYVLDYLNFIVKFEKFCAYPVPVGVCIIIAVLAIGCFVKLQNNRRKDYEGVNGHYTDTISELRSILKDREKRIKELESQLGFNRKKRKGGK